MKLETTEINRDNHLQKIINILAVKNTTVL